MKLKQILWMASLPFLLLTSCEDEEMGKWGTIKVSQDKVFFDAEGGSAHVDRLNYDGWWISSVKVCDSGCYYYMDDNGSVMAEGLSAKIADSKGVTISVDPSGKDRRWEVCMTVGDSFRTITVVQEGSADKD